jgi:tetratricopeptide (TPR) repeat protein
MGVNCLDDSTILRLVSGRLEGKAYSDAEEELGRCSRCAELVAEMLHESSAMIVPLSSGDSSGVGEKRCDIGPDTGGREFTSRYILGSEIARGGMGVIVTAYDQRLDRSVAVKLLDSEEPVLQARFAREIRVTASLQHPGIVPIYDAGALPDGRLFYAMRHVPGASMEQVMAATYHEAPRLDLLVSVMAAADAVAYAHDHGIIHRDLKPSNILVGRFGETVVIDWGLARVEDAGTLDEPSTSTPEPSPDRTRDGTVLGTPRYMAPEQARGEPATRGSDVYALGAILYHALSGVPPVEADQVRAVLEQVSRAETRPLAQVVPGLPVDLVAIVERAMRLAPESRYTSAAELAADLRRFQAGQLVAAHAYSRRELVRRFLRRHKTMVAVVSLFTVVLALGGILGIRGIIAEREKAELQRQQAELQRQTAVREREGAEVLIHFLLHELRSKLATVGRLDVLSGVADRVESYYLTTAGERAEQPEALRERASLYELRAAVASTAADGAAADRHLKRGLELIARAPTTPRSEEVRAELLDAMGRRAAQTGELARARGLHLDSAAINRLLTPDDSMHRRRLLSKVSASLTAAARLADQLGKVNEAEREWDEVRAILSRLRAEDANDLEVIAQLGELDTRVGRSRYLRGLVAEAQTSYEQALVELEALVARAPKNVQSHEQMVWTLLGLGEIDVQRGNLQRADSLFERALEVARPWLALEPASANWLRMVARAETSLGMMASHRRDPATAVRRHEAARAAYDRLVRQDPTHRGYRRGQAIAFASIAEAEQALHNRDPARRAWLAALVQLAHLAESGAADARIEWAYGLRGYAAFERGLGRLASAREPLEQALALVEATPFAENRSHYQFYRAAVFAEVGFHRAVTSQLVAARSAWRRAASMLGELATTEALDPDGHKLLRDVQSELGRRQRSARRGRGS